MTLHSDRPRFLFHVAQRATALGLSQVRLSQRSELSRDTIQRYWTNAIQRPDILVLSKLAQVLRCRIADLITIDELSGADACTPCASGPSADSPPADGR